MSTIYKKNYRATLNKAKGNATAQSSATSRSNALASVRSATNKARVNNAKSAITGANRNTATGGIKKTLPHTPGTTVKKQTLPYTSGTAKKKTY